MGAKCAIGTCSLAYLRPVSAERAGRRGSAQIPYLIVRMGSRRVYVYSGLAVVSMLYALQAFSPLRLSTDSVVYLTMATSAADGEGFLAHSRTDIFPHGYPALISLLIRAGLGASATFVLLNLVFLGIGLFAGFHLLRRHVNDASAIALCGMTLLSFVTVKYATQAIADFVFFGIMMIALLALTRIPELRGRKRVLAALTALAATVAAIYLRTIGIALLPALGWAFLPNGSLAAFRERLHSGWVRVAIAVGAIAVLTALGVALARSRYVDELLRNYAYWGVYEALEYSAIAKMREWAELVMNVPYARMPYAVQFLMWPVGAVSLLVVLSSLVSARRAIGPLEVFLLGYVVILLLYPAQQPRYWLPILMLLLWKVVEAAKRWMPQRYVRSSRIGGAAYLLWFGTLGLVALGYSTRLTFSGDEFPERYGDGTLTAVYAAAFDGEGDPALLRQPTMRLLVRFEPRVHPRWIAVREGDGPRATPVEVPSAEPMEAR